MQLAERMKQIPSSPTVAQNTQAKQMIADGISVINLTVGEPDFPTPEPITHAAINAIKNGRTRYGPPGGGAEFRAAVVAKLARENSLDFKPDQIVAGIGAKQVLFHIAIALLNEGDEVLLPSPYWVSYQAQIQAMGAKAVIVPIDLSKTSERLTPALLDKYATPKTKMIMLNSPNNPAGYVLNESELKEIGGYLADKEWWVVSDEIYEYLSFKGPHVSLLKLCPQLADRFILVNGMAKGFAMTGWRVGYAAAPSQVAGALRKLQSQSSTCLPGFIEDAATFALGHGKDLVRNEIASLHERRDYILKKFKEELPELTILDPEGAFYIYAFVGPLLEKSSKFEANDTVGFCNYLLEEKHLAVVAGEAFGTPGWFRLSYAASRKNLDTAVEKLKEVIHDLSKD